MRSTWALCVALTLLACEPGAGGEGGETKGARDPVGPIERELRRTTGGDEAGGSPSAAAERPSAERDTDGVADRVTDGRTRRRAGSDVARPARGRGPGSAPAPVAAAPSRAVRPEPAADRVAVIEPRAEGARPASPEAEASEPAPARVELTRVVVARAVEAREPVGAPPFASDVDRAFLFVEARYEGETDAALAVEWIAPDGTPGAPIALRVPPAPRWRTWATTSRVGQQPGVWTVVVRQDGAELARETFRVLPAGEGPEMASAAPAADPAG